jgi:hypothetical protein
MAKAGMIARINLAALPKFNIQIFLFVRGANEDGFHALIVSSFIPNKSNSGDSPLMIVLTDYQIA